MRDLHRIVLVGHRQRCDITIKIPLCLTSACGSTALNRPGPVNICSLHITFCMDLSTVIHGPPLTTSPDKLWKPSSSPNGIAFAADACSAGRWPAPHYRRKVGSRSTRQQARTQTGAAIAAVHNSGARAHSNALILDRSGPEAAGRSPTIVSTTPSPTMPPRPVQRQPSRPCGARRSRVARISTSTNGIPTTSPRIHRMPAPIK